MKQHITGNQLKETNIIKLKDLLAGDTKNRYERMTVDYFQYTDEGSKISTLNAMARLLTIGKMIEILKINSGRLVIEASTNQPCEWFVEFAEKNGYQLSKEYKSKELCDALWEAVKSVLL